MYIVLHFFVKNMFTAYALTVNVEGFATARIEVWYETDSQLA